MSSTNLSDPSFNNNHILHDSSANALKLALTAMKDRCQKLQNRLSSLEEENLQLRIERHSIPGLVKKELDSDSASLHKRIEELTRQKSKLSHHIFMVATENKNLWEKLSDLSEVRSGPTSSDLKPNKSLQIIQFCQNGRDQSLEEIPLKGSNGLNKVPYNMNWQSTGPVKECEFPIEDVDDGCEIDEMVQSEIAEILGKLMEEKVLLKQQQEGLKSAVETITQIAKDGFPCKTCSTRNEEDARSSLAEEFEDPQSLTSELDEKNRSEGEVLKVANGVRNLKSKENNFEDRICPLCTKFYAKSTPFDEFNDHVLSHFVEEAEQDSHMSMYEIVA